MRKEITVRSAANVRVKPDYVNILIDIVTRGHDYSVCMSDAAHKIQSLQKALEKVNVNAEDLRTTDFGIDTEWEWIDDANGNRTKRVFAGYKIHQKLKFGFDSNREMIGAILGGIAKSGVNAEFGVQFTVKDASFVQAELFAKASENARKIAEGLSRGVGKKLGDIININYSWHELDVYNEIRVEGNLCETSACSAPDINPDDLNVSDSVIFTWELL